MKFQSVLVDFLNTAVSHSKLLPTPSSTEEPGKLIKALHLKVVIISGVHLVFFVFGTSILETISLRKH